MLENNQDQERAPVLFAYGFRPFFLLGGIWSVAVMVTWLLMLETFWKPVTFLVPPLWHAHEMLFGFVAASAAGFLLTASPNWSSKPPLKGRPLMVLAVFWVLGRLAISFSSVLNPWLVAFLDMLFTVSLIAVTGPPLWNTGNKVHRLFPLLLGLLTIGNLLTHWEAVGLAADTARLGLYLGVDALIFFLVMVGGHIMPMFTRNALMQTENLPPFKIIPALEIAGAVTMLGVVLADIVYLGDPLAGLFLLAAGIVQGVRFSKWHSLKTLKTPLLWVLHLGYAWLIAGLVVRGLAQITGFLPLSTALHILSVGAMGLFTLGIMSRVSLAHTGRPLAAGPTLATSYALVALATVVRVLGVDYWPVWSLRISGALWIAAFLLFLVFSLPVLLRPRPDGQPG